MNTMVQVPSDNMGALMERVLIEGDLSRLSPSERVSYYTEVCRSAGLNPLTKPFAYLQLNNKLQLYALKACTDQLRFVHGISVEEVTNKTVSDVYVVTAKVKNAAGRTDVDDGAVNISGIKGEALANAFMKATTKAKRRATLSICGLGMLDESEVESIPNATRIQETYSPPSPPKVLAASSPSPPSAPKSPAQRAETQTLQAGPRALPVPVENGKERFTHWGKEIITAIMASVSHDELDAWRKANIETLTRCEQAAPRAFGSIQKAITKKSNELLEGQKAQPPASPLVEDDEYQDWLAELDACQSAAAVEDLRERAIPNMFPGDIGDFKEKCAEKAAELFRRK